MSNPKAGYLTVRGDMNSESDEIRHGAMGTRIVSARVTQTILADPELQKQGVYGNCFQAAVASLLDLPLDAVPHFAAFEWWPQAVQLWAWGRGLRMVGERTQTIPERACIVGGRSPRGFAHVVVAEGGVIVWDPHPSRDGLTTVEDATWFEPLEEGAHAPNLWGPVHAAYGIPTDTLEAELERRRVDD